MANFHVSLTAETLFHIGSFPVTNAFVNAVVAMVLLLIVALYVRVMIKEVPGKFQGFLEAGIEALLGLFDKVTHNRALSEKFLPISGTLFFFILLSNWLGLLPGTGSIGLYHVVDGVREFVPLLRPANSDLNLTLAMSLLSVLASHAFGFATIGFMAHANKFIQVRGIWRACKTLSPTKILVAFVEFIVGIIEIFGEIAKVASLSLRLFGNIFAGEVLMTVIASLIAYGAPLPFMFLELLVGMVQAIVFAILSLVYLTVASMKPHGDHDHDKAHDAQSGHAHTESVHA